MCLCRLGRRAPARQNREHCPPFHRRRALHNRDIRHPGGNPADLIPRHLGMRRLASAEPHLDFDLVAFLEEPPRRPYSDLQIVIIGAWPNPHLLDFRDVLILLGIAGALVLLELELPQIGDAAHGWIGRGRDFDQIKPGFFSPANSFLDRQNPDLSAVRVEDADLGDTNLAIGTRTSGGWRARYEWWTRNRRFSLLTNVRYMEYPEM